MTWNAAAIAETIHEAKAYGFSVKETAPFDWTTFKYKRDAYVRRLNSICEKNLEKDKVEWLHGCAHFLSKNGVEVVLHDGTKQTIRAKNILIATGGHPSIPKHVPGSELGITSDGFFELEMRSGKVALVGAGYIDVEMARMFHHLGSETHLFIRHDTFLRTFDPMIQEIITVEYERQGIIIHRQSSQQRLEKDPTTGKLTLHYSDSTTKASTFDLDCLLWAIGRAPEVEDLALQNIGVKQSEKGHIIADEYQNTNIPHIYALGDVCGHIELTPVAIVAGRLLANRLFSGPAHKSSKLDYSNIPGVVSAQTRNRLYRSLRTSCPRKIRDRRY